MESEDKIYKRYPYPNGEFLDLTREEFDNVVSIFRMLHAADQSLQNKKQFESLSHQASDNKEKRKTLEPDKIEDPRK